MSTALSLVEEPKSLANGQSGFVPQTFESWQLKRQLPNTEPNSDHRGINVGCAKCGGLILRDEEIVLIRHGSIWSTRNPEFVLIQWNDEKVDEKKKCRYSDVRCEVCNHLVGMFYHEKPQFDEQSKEAKLNYPCAKILYLRQSADGSIFNKTLLLGEKGLVDLAIDHLLTAKTNNNVGNKSPP
jgi:hypothetical protein